MHIRGAETVIVGENTRFSTTTHHTETGAPAERPTFADDIMPAALTTLPILFVIMMLALTDQTILLRSIVQEGNPVGLAILFIPLFSPSIVASLVYFAKTRGWIRLTARWANILALTPAGFLGLFVPLNYLGLQVGVFALSLIWLRVRHRDRIWRLSILGMAATIIITGLGEVSEWKWRRVDHLSRTAVGRIVDGLTRLNIDDQPGGRSVLVISVNDAYAIVASREYPPTVGTVPLEVLERGRLCQVPPRWNQVGLIRHMTGSADELANHTEICIDR